MRLAIFFPDNVIFDGAHYYTKDYRHHQFSEIARHFDNTEFIVFTRFCTDVEGLELIDTSCMSVIGLPGFRDMKPFITSTGWERRVFELPYLFLAVAELFFRRRNAWDVILIFDPYFTNIFLSLLALVFKKPAVFFVGARWDTNLLVNISNESVDRRLANYIKSLFYRLSIPAVVRFMPTAVTGQEIYDLYNHNGTKLVKIATTVVRREHIDHEIVTKRIYGRSPLKLLTVCRITPVKSIETLIESISVLKVRGIHVDLYIVGPAVSDSYLNLLESRTRELGVEDRIIFTGPVNCREHIMQYYADADIFVLPSVSEGIPKVIAEAMAKGLPLIATRVGGLPELIENGVNGILIEPKDILGLAAAIELISLNPVIQRSLSIASLEGAEKYTLEVQMEKLACFLKSACRTKVMK